jgi:gamma-glutamyltranspeptidase
MMLTIRASLKWPDTVRLGAIVLSLILLPCGARGNVAEGVHGMVATVQPQATEAGVAILNDGGNAVDAAIAAALTLGVVDGLNSGIGGCFMLVRPADGGILALDGRETTGPGPRRICSCATGRRIPTSHKPGRGGGAKVTVVCRLCGVLRFLYMYKFPVIFSPSMAKVCLTAGDG